jgi:hypothetical protein
MPKSRRRLKKSKVEVEAKVEKNLTLALTLIQKFELGHLALAHLTYFF